MTTTTTINIEAEFGERMAAHGLNPPEIIADGMRHRFNNGKEKAGRKSGWYKLFGDGVPTGIFGDWADPSVKGKWSAKSENVMTPPEYAEHCKRIEKAKQEAEFTRLSLEEEAAKKCAAILASAQDATDDNPYCMRKGIKTYGLKEFKDKRTLIVPIRDGSGAVTSLQFIDADGAKRFKSNGKITGCYYSFGGKPVDTLLLCEGYATGASLHAATGSPVAVAFNAGNLEPVAKVLRDKLPDIRIIVCADNDRFKEHVNVGLDKATAAALAVDGLLAIPVFASDNGHPTDFNDLHQLEGVEAVKGCIDAAESSGDEPAGATGFTTVSEIAKASRELKEKREAERIAAGIPFGFSISNTGVFYTPEGSDDKPGKPMRVCAPLRVSAFSRDKSSENWGRVVEFSDADGIRHEWAVPMEMMAGDGADVRRELSRLGLVIASSMSAKTKLMEYLTASEPKARARCVQQTGWFDNVFVMPGKTIGESRDLVMYQAESKTACQYAQAGTLAEWRDNVAALCTGNSRLIFAVSAAFAGMTLHHAKQESGGFHFVGESGTGKTTAQQVAASVYGGPSFKQSWKATGNALEGACTLHNDAALILDELAEVDAREVGSIVYMIGNGTGKGRAGRTGDARQRKTWRLMIISSGEIGLAQHMRDGGKTTRAGQEVRMIDVAVDGAHGMFDNLHDFDGGAQLSDAIKEATQAYYGTPAIAFLEHLTSDIKTFPTLLKQAMNRFTADNLPAGAGGQASRVCSKFALIAIAGEYATDAGITGWQQGDAVAAAATCFKSWLDGRGGGGNQERAAILSSVKAFFESHGESRFSDVADTSDRVTINRAGYRRTTGDSLEFLVLPEAYKRDICAGHDMKAVTKVLVDAGWIELDAEGKSSQRMRLPDMGRTRCYIFTPKMWEV